MSTDRETLRSLVEELSDDDVRELLAVVRQRSGDADESGLAWIGALHEGPDFAKRAKETIRAEWAAGQ